MSGQSGRKSPRRSLPCRLSAGLCALALLVGCNKIGLVYEFADRLVLYGVEDNFDLDKPQRARLKESVREYFRWHRKNMLPAYAEYLSALAGSARNGLRPEEIREGSERFHALYRRTLEPAGEKAAEFFEGLTPSQVDQWLERQRSKNRKLRQDFSGSLDERLAHRAGRIIDELEDWTGKLSREQKARIRDLNRTIPWNGFLWLELREQVQANVAEMAKRRAPRDSLAAYLTAYFTRDESLKSPEYRERIRESEVRIGEMIYRIQKLLTEAQRARLVLQVGNLAQDLRKRSASE